MKHRTFPKSVLAALILASASASAQAPQYPEITDLPIPVLLQIEKVPRFPFVYTTQNSGLMLPGDVLHAQISGDGRLSETRTGFLWSFDVNHVTFLDDGRETSWATRDRLEIITDFRGHELNATLRFGDPAALPQSVAAGVYRQKLRQLFDGLRSGALTRRSLPSAQGDAIASITDMAGARMRRQSLQPEQSASPAKLTLMGVTRYRGRNAAVAQGIGNFRFKRGNGRLYVGVSTTMLIDLVTAIPLHLRSNYVGRIDAGGLVGPVSYQETFTIGLPGKP